MSWSWGSFGYGVICAWSLPWVVFAAAVCLCRAVRAFRAAQEWQRRLRALTEPGHSAIEVMAALAARQARRDADAAEELIRSLGRST